MPSCCIKRDMHIASVRAVSRPPRAVAAGNIKTRPYISK